MRKLLTILLLFISATVFAQNTTILPSGTQPTGINVRLLNSPDSLKQYWFQSTLDNKWTRMFSATELGKLFKQKADTATLFVRLTDQSNLSFSSPLWKDRKLMYYTINQASSTQFPCSKLA